MKNDIGKLSHVELKFNCITQSLTGKTFIKILLSENFKNFQKKKKTDKKLSNKNHIKYSFNVQQKNLYFRVLDYTMINGMEYNVKMPILITP